MKAKKSVLAILILLFGCVKSEKHDVGFYYVIKHTGVQSPDIYGTHNFIILDSTVFYFHKEPPKYVRCGNGFDGRPERLFLTPNSLEQIALNELSGLLDKIYPDSSYYDLRHQYCASISSPTDTIRNGAFSIFWKFFKEKQIKLGSIRNWTEEEQHVTLAKINNQIYVPKEIDWKIGFDTSYTSYLLESGEVDRDKQSTQ